MRAGVEDVDTLRKALVGMRSEEAAHGVEYRIWFKAKKRPCSFFCHFTVRKPQAVEHGGVLDLFERCRMQ
jgi:hypothetical protein